MMKRLFTRAISILLIIAFMNGCAATTKMTVNVMSSDGKPVTDAVVMVDGINIGQTPNAMTKVSNFFGSKPEIMVIKEGFEPVKTEAAKEVKAVNIVLGIVMLNVFSWMWVYGPKSQQNIILAEQTTL